MILRDNTEQYTYGSQFPTMKSIGGEKPAPAKDEVKEAVDAAKTAFEGALNAGAIAAASINSMSRKN